MSDDLSERVDALAFIPETFREWIIRSRVPNQAGQNWRHYLLLMLAYTEAFARAPMTAEDCNGLDIVSHLDKELEHLTHVVRQIMSESERRH